eukprot:CAMPEP_0179119102 /NCGR_PEP_ID=MMETSP0796-20121207/56052_1 /TAXON_ID=73915 /ORGANISM="Pyrodinium bahamense, Strain pbaha01" /LENGTH=293 /DNA_ID=CAMNT_0020817593 /DNA_START=81 /DNA_END=962 /DNA_ORIENTATION=-
MVTCCGARDRGRTRGMVMYQVSVEGGVARPLLEESDGEEGQTLEPLEEDRVAGSPTALEHRHGARDPAPRLKPPAGDARDVWRLPPALPRKTSEFALLTPISTTTVYPTRQCSKEILDLSEVLDVEASVDESVVGLITPLSMDTVLPHADSAGPSRVAHECEARGRMRGQPYDSTAHRSRGRSRDESTSRGDTGFDSMQSADCSEDSPFVASHPAFSDTSTWHFAGVLQEKLLWEDSVMSSVVVPHSHSLGSSVTTACVDEWLTTEARFSSKVLTAEDQGADPDNGLPEFSYL